MTDLLISCIIYIQVTPPSERIEKLVAEIRKRTAQEAYALTIQPERKPTIFDSKFGGLPYWDLQKPYPTDPEGEKMLLLAQINFDKAEVDAPLPQRGMLQFFTANNDVFGLNFGVTDQQTTFRVVYHETIDPIVTAEQVEGLDIPVGVRCEGVETPVFQEVAVEISRKTAYSNPLCYGFGEVANSAVQQVCGVEAAWEDILTEDESYDLDELLVENRHWMLGYPFFTQDDPREYEDHTKYDTLLFQMTSEMDDNYKDYIFWGDCGVGNFFIAREDLEKCDFSRVLYNWDCG